jgi:NAD(P)H dehydrogenase (quinone)
MKVGVTAASGRLGHAILPELVAALGSENVVGIARDPARIRIPDPEKRAGDYGDPNSLVEALTGIDVVIMISAPIEVGADRLAMHANVIDAAKQAKVRKLIYTSVIGDPVDEDALFYPSQLLNHYTETLVRDSGLEWVIARNGLYLDLDLKSIRAAAESGVYRNNGLDGRCGYISIAELGSALAQLAARDVCTGETLNLTSENLTQAEMIALANEVFGLNVVYEPITAQQCIDKFMAIPAYAARGLEVAQMLAGCFECIAAGKFDVPSDFEHAAGRPPLAVRAQLEQIRAAD